MINALQQQLIHPDTPPPISWWPPAVGWWIVAGSLLLILLLLPWLRRRSRRNSRRKHQAMRAFRTIPAELSDTHWLAEVNIRLKQICKQRGDEAATRLFGEAWLDYLCQRYPGAQRDILQPLAADLYRPQFELDQGQRQALLKELRRWVRHDDI